MNNSAISGGSYSRCPFFAGMVKVGKSIEKGFSLGGLCEMFKQLLIHVRDVRESDLDPIGGNQVKRARRSFSGGTTKAKLTRHKTQRYKLLQ